jgi:integrase
MASFEKLPSGRWRAVTWDPYRKRKAKTKAFDADADRPDQAPVEAEAWAARVELDIWKAYKANGIEIERKVKPITFAEYATRWSRPGPPSTRQVHRSNARALAKVWPTERIADVTPAMVRAMLFDVAEAGLSVGTRTARLTVARHIFQDAILEGLRTDDPTAGIKGPKQVKDSGRHREITEDELSRIMAKLPEWTHAAVLLSRDSGLRIGEVCGLPWHRLDLLHGRVTVSDVVLCDGSTRETPKGGTVYTVPLSTRAVAALRAHMERWPGGKRDRVFREPGKGCDLVKPARVRALWERARAAAGIEYPLPRWHDLRHSRGHALARAGAPIQVIQAVLRHENIATTRLYMGSVPISELERWMRAADGPSAGEEAAS